MPSRSARNPHKEEDEGYLAAEARQKLTDNPYPAGTLRHTDWRHGWFSHGAETERAAHLGRVIRPAAHMSVMQQLYDSEINVTVSAFYDDGFYVKLGDEMNGFISESRCDTWADVEEWAAVMAVILYPDSEFARGQTGE